MNPKPNHRKPVNPKHKPWPFNHHQAGPPWHWQVLSRCGASLESTTTRPSQTFSVPGHQNQRKQTWDSRGRKRTSECNVWVVQVQKSKYLLQMYVSAYMYIIQYVYIYIPICGRLENKHTHNRHVGNHYCTWSSNSETHPVNCQRGPSGDRTQSPHLVMNVCM